MSNDPSQEFRVSASLRRKSQAEKLVEKEGCFGLSLTVSLRRNVHVLLIPGSERPSVISFVFFWVDAYGYICWNQSFCIS